MLDVFLFVGLPYLSLAVLLVGTFYRFRYTRINLSSGSTEFLEKNQLGYGSAPWHIGILIVFLGHVAAFLIPGLWIALTSSRPFLLIVEAIGLAAALIAAAGLLVLLYRRISVPWVQAVTQASNLIVLALLLAQTGLGIAIAVGHRWGAAWSAGTTTPYLWSLLTFRPEPSYVADLPPLIKAHLVGAWLVFLIIPFTRLVHMFAAPVQYLFRVPQKVVWTSRRYLERVEASPGGNPETARRHLVQGLIGAAASVVLLGAGAADRIFRFLGKQELPRERRADIMAQRQTRVQLTAEERALELERIRNDYILVGRLSELQAGVGRYFIDYKMRPALAFRGADGLPILISARCTHLGCTVGSEVDDKGRILCPCHISFFDIKTGQPNAGAPAREPLPRVGWVLREDDGNVVARMSSTGVYKGPEDPNKKLDGCSVYIAKECEEDVL